MSRIARKFSIVRFVTFTDFDPHFDSLKDGANRTHVAFSRSPKESDCSKVSIQTVSLRKLQKAEIDYVKKTRICPHIRHEGTGGVRGIGQLKSDGTRAETRFRLSAKRTSTFKSAGGVSSVDYWQPS